MSAQPDVVGTIGDELARVPQSTMDALVQKFEEYELDIEKLKRQRAGLIEKNAILQMSKRRVGIPEILRVKALGRGMAARAAAAVSPDVTIRDLSLLVARLARALEKVSPDHPLVAGANDYLGRKGVVAEGPMSPLRAVAASSTRVVPEPTGEGESPAVSVGEARSEP